MLMKLQVGHVVRGKIRFRDGEVPKYKRPYLIVAIRGNEADVLNISTTDGKEWKLAMRSNYVISNYNPPLEKPSFAKLDSLVTVDIEQLIQLPLWGESPLDSKEVEKILAELAEYQGKKKDK